MLPCAASLAFVKALFDASVESFYFGTSVLFRWLFFKEFLLVYGFSFTSFGRLFFFLFLKARTFCVGFDFFFFP